MQATHTPLTTERIIAVCRELLTHGGVEAIVIREVARRLDVTAPALYKHAAGRDELLTLLIAACHREVAGVCEQARDASDPDDASTQLRDVTTAFRRWALANPREFGLLYGQPIIGYSAPVGGPTTRGAQRFGTVFSAIYAQLLHEGRLRTPSAADLPAGFAESLTTSSLSPEYHLPPVVMYQFAMGFQRMLGLISVEVSGHLGWAMSDTDAFALQELENLVIELTTS
ncbi:MAG: TetR/AcrR family transcriptional regulator [Ornithinimicrobium sp.]